MHSAKLFSAVLAFSAGMAIADDCSQDKITIKSATDTIDCNDVLEGDLIIDASVSGQLSLEGPKQIKGNVIVRGAKVSSISSNSINAIGGTFEMSGLNSLNSVNMDSLKSVGILNMTSLNFLTSLAFGKSGVTTAKEIHVVDTSLRDLSGLSVSEVETFTVQSNSDLNMFNSDLEAVNNTLIFYQNGNNDVAINMTHLQSAGDVQISGVKAFNVPGLQEITAGLKLVDNPQLESFKAPNLTDLTGTITFSKNNNLANVSFPELTEIKKGDITLDQNKNLTDFTGFPKLEKIDGSLRLKGSFETVDLPKLTYVRGAVEATTSSNNTEFCSAIDKLKSNGSIKGDEKCSTNNKNANNSNADVSQGEESDGSDKSSDSAAGVVSVDNALLGLVALAGVMQML